MGSTQYDDLLELQKTLGDEFEEFRTGKDPTMNPARLDFTGPLGRAPLLGRPHPRPGRWPGLDAATVPAVRRPRFQRPFRHDTPGRGSSDRLKHARRAAKKMTRELEVAGFRFVRILGFGGLGVASLYEAEDKDAETGVRRRVVCKMDLWDAHPLIWQEVNTHMVCDLPLFIVGRWRGRVVLTAPGMCCREWPGRGTLFRES